MWKPFDPNPDRNPGRPVDRPWTSAPVELFLDFDPIVPGWPPAPEASPPTGAGTGDAGPSDHTVITIDDFRRLRAALRDGHVRRQFAAGVNALERKLRQARIVLPADVAADVVTMNSTVRVFDAATGDHAPVTVVYPRHLGRNPGAVSVLSSLGTAILGRRAGERVGSRATSGSPRFAIDRILYQPEAAGDLHL
jgi:regulator of nucleoside diphosphate kinase